MSEVLKPGFESERFRKGREKGWELEKVRRPPSLRTQGSDEGSIKMGRGWGRNSTVRESTNPVTKVPEDIPTDHDPVPFSSENDRTELPY